MRTSVNVRRGVAVGAGLVVIFGASVAARSDAPLQVFGETMLVGLVAVPLGIAIALATYRLRAMLAGGGDIPPLNVRRAVLVGLGVGGVVEAAVSIRSSMPLSTFISNSAFVLWVALLVALGMLAIERHRSRHAIAR